MSRDKGNHEMAGLRIVRGAHDVAFEFVAPNTCIAALGAARHRLSAEPHDTDPDRGGGHDTLEVDENVAASRFGRQFEAPAVNGDKLIGFVVEAVPGQADIRVRNDDAFESGVVELAPARTFNKRFAVSSMPVAGKNHAPLGHGIAGERWMARKRAGCKRCARDDRARRLQKVAHVHTLPFV
jgi:hypothetical protein